MPKINLMMSIDYDCGSHDIDNYEIFGKYTIGEIAVIISTFKQCLADYGYEVKRKVE